MTMLINVPIFFYASALLLVVWALEELLDADNGYLGTDWKSNASNLPLWLQYAISPKTLSFLRLRAWLPLLSVLGVVAADLPRKWNLWWARDWQLCDGDGKVVQPGGGLLSWIIPDGLAEFLPDPEHSSQDRYRRVFQRLVDEANAPKVEPNKLGAYGVATTSPRASWALVTGASGGIGRALAVSLARRKIPVVLVARNGHKLASLARELYHCYGVGAIPIACDLADDTSLQSLIATLSADVPDYGGRLMGKIEVLINNAGVGLSHFFLDDADGDAMDAKVEQVLQLNVVGTTKLTRAVGRHMVNNSKRSRNGGRICVVASLMGAIPGNPGSAVYAASKAYLRSWCCGVGRELEHQTGGRVGVTCSMMGATSKTGFQETSHMMDSAVFEYDHLGLVLRPEHVAESTVIGTLKGHREVHVGAIYWILPNICARLFPDRLTAILCELTTADKSFLNLVWYYQWLALLTRPTEWSRTSRKTSKISPSDANGSSSNGVKKTN